MVHPPCLKCNPSFVPADYDPITPISVMKRPDGQMLIVGGAVRCTLDGEDVTDLVASADPNRGATVLNHLDENGKEHVCGEKLHVCQEVRYGDVQIVDVATNEAPVLVSAE